MVAGVDHDAAQTERQLMPSDLERCMTLSIEAKWNQTENDWIYLIGNATTYAIEVAGRGVVATTVAWPLSSGFAWINMVLVDEDFRGQGMARRLLESCLKDLEARGQRALLDATAMGERVYRKIGFSGEVEIVRLKRMAVEGGPDNSTQSEVSGMETVQAVLDCDRRVLGESRSSFLESLYARRPDLARVVLGDSGEVRGFGLGREGRVATQIGPVVAPTSTLAAALIDSALVGVTGAVMIDVPVQHHALIERLTQKGFSIERGFLRMGMKGVELATDWSQYFAIAGPDFA